MKLDYEGLFVLAAVVRAGSFEAAATALGVTQSAVSQRIKQMEERLGLSLVIRGRPSRATEEGLILCQHLESVSLLESELMERFEGGGPETEATITVRVSVNSDSLATWFPKALKRLTQETRIRLEIISDDQDFTEERLKNGDALAIVTSSDRPIPGSTNVRLGQMDYMAVCTAQFYETYFACGVSRETIAKAPCISFDRKDSLPGQWILLAQDEIPVLDTHFIPSFEGHLLCCKQGIGWAMMPSITVGELVERGELREVIPGQLVQIPLFWQMRNQSSRILQKITDIVRDVAAHSLK